MSQSKELYAPKYLKDYHLFFNLKNNKKHLKRFYKSKKKVLYCGVNYITNNESIELIKKYFPNAKILILLRNPIKRALSAFRYCKRMGIENRSIDKVLSMELDKKINLENIDPDRDYLRHGLYFNQINKNVLPYFNRKDIGIFIFEEIFSKQQINIDLILEFLKIESFKFSNKTKLNYQGEPKLRFINKILFSRNKVKQVISYLLPAKIRVYFKNYIYKKNYTQSFQNEKSVNIVDISNYFKNDILKLSKFVGKDLTNMWLDET